MSPTSRTRSFLASAVAAFVLAGATACSTGQSARSPFDRGSGGDRATIVVDNTNSGMSDLTVYLEHEHGRRDRLGSVSLSERKSFVVRNQDWGARFRLTGDPLGGRDIRTRVFRLHAGMDVIWNVSGNNLFLGGAP